MEMGMRALSPKRRRNLLEKMCENEQFNKYGFPIDSEAFISLNLDTLAERMSGEIDFSDILAMSSEFSLIYDFISDDCRKSLVNPSDLESLEGITDEFNGLLHTAIDRTHKEFRRSIDKSNKSISLVKRLDNEAKAVQACENQKAILEICDKTGSVKRIQSRYEKKSYFEAFMSFHRGVRGVVDGLHERMSDYLKEVVARGDSEALAKEYGAKIDEEVARAREHADKVGLSGYKLVSGHSAYVFIQKFKDELERVARKPTKYVDLKREMEDEIHKVSESLDSLGRDHESSPAQLKKVVAHAGINPDKYSSFTGRYLFGGLEYAYRSKAEELKQRAKVKVDDAKKKLDIKLDDIALRGKYVDESDNSQTSVDRLRICEDVKKRLDELHAYFSILDSEDRVCSRYGKMVNQSGKVLNRAISEYENGRYTPEVRRILTSFYS